MLLVILFNATFFIRLGDGPFWRHAAAAEYTFCREYWWKNFFMINNFMLKESVSMEIINYIKSHKKLWLYPPSINYGVLSRVTS